MGVAPPYTGFRASPGSRLLISAGMTGLSSRSPPADHESPDGEWQTFGITGARVPVASDARGSQSSTARTAGSREHSHPPFQASHRLRISPAQGLGHKAGGLRWPGRCLIGVSAPDLSASISGQIKVE